MTTVVDDHSVLKSKYSSPLRSQIQKCVRRQTFLGGAKRLPVLPLAILPYRIAPWCVGAPACCYAQLWNGPRRNVRLQEPFQRPFQPAWSRIEPLQETFPGTLQGKLCACACMCVS